MTVIVSAAVERKLRFARLMLSSIAGGCAVIALAQQPARSLRPAPPAAQPAPATPPAATPPAAPAPARRAPHRRLH